MGITNAQVSRNHSDGIKAGETVSVTRIVNGPWTGNIDFTSDIAGDYQISVNLDVNKELNEVNKLNNGMTMDFTFNAPADMSGYALERAVKLHASVASANDLASLLRTAQTKDAQSKTAVYRAISDGWNYRRKDINLNAANVAFLKTLDVNGNSKLERLLNAWEILDPEAVDENVKIITIKAIREAMKYNLTDFTVKAGETVEIVFVNPDAMQHNIVIIQPGSTDKVGAAADKMITQADAAEKNYVPEIAEVLFSSPLVNPDETFKLRFKVPSTLGDYPFICTFPGHWRLIKGVMRVE